METSCEIEIRFADIDVMGHVNNAVYLSYFEQARMDFFADLVGKNWDWESDGILLARNEVDYHEPVLLSDTLRIVTKVEQIGNTSLTLTYTGFRKALGAENETVCVKGRSVLVCFDYHSRSKKQVPDAWRTKLS
jgi:acyl-CoA thioester hydrolase